MNFSQQIPRFTSIILVAQIPFTHHHSLQCKQNKTNRQTNCGVFKKSIILWFLCGGIKKIWFSFIIYGLYICELKRKIISRTEDGKNSHALWESDTFSGLLKVDETTITSSYPNQVEINSDLFTWENPFYRDVIDP